MSNQWYYNQDGAQYGPVDEAVIIRLIQEGELAPGTPVLKKGSNDWQPARNHACFQVEIYPRKKLPKQVANFALATVKNWGKSECLVHDCLLTFIEVKVAQARFTCSQSYKKHCF
jgi:hypothetical protein